MQAPPWPSASIANVAVAACGAVPLHGVSRAETVCVPQAAGLAITACGPPWNVSANDVNGTCGRLSNTVVIWPVAGSSFTSPGSATVTPWPWTTMYSRKPSPKKTLPPSTPSSGVSKLTVPTWLAAGQATAANWSAVQATRPSATPGESVVPTGSAISARRTWESSAGWLSVTVAPVGATRCVVSSDAVSAGRNGSLAQPVGVNVADCTVSASIVVVAGRHDVGIVMNVLFSVRSSELTGSPPVASATRSSSPARRPGAG